MVCRVRVSGSRWRGKEEWVMCKEIGSKLLRFESLLIICDWIIILVGCVGFFVF